MIDPHPARPTRRLLFRDAALTLASVLLAFAALDDITTDADTSFAFERFALLACATCVLAVAWHLVRGGHRLLGSLSVVILAVAVAAGSMVDRGAAPITYLVTFGGLVWFLALAGILAGLAWRSEKPHAA